VTSLPVPKVPWLLLVLEFKILENPEPQFCKCFSLKKVFRMSSLSLSISAIYPGCLEFFALVVLERLKEALTLHGDADMHTKIEFQLFVRYHIIDRQNGISY